jgi:hypothetical protein
MVKWPFFALFPPYQSRKYCKNNKIATSGPDKSNSSGQLKKIGSVVRSALSISYMRTTSDPENKSSPLIGARGQIG